MPKLDDIIIDSIFAGHSPSDFFAGDGQFQSSIAIDPEMPKDDSSKRPSGAIRPVGLTDFSGANVNSAPMWLVTNPKNALVYAILANGNVISYSSSLGSETLITTLATCSGNGAEYYDNALYVARNTDIAKYTPLDGTPSFDTAYWDTTLAKTALVNTTYPSIRGHAMPNHVLFRHTNNNRMYICDVVGGKGVLHFIQTTKTTNEGDTNDGSGDQNNSDAGTLDFGYGLYPTCIANLGANLIIGLIEGTNTTIRQKPAKLALWDTASDSYDIITDNEFTDPLITALLNVNGTVYVWSGAAVGGCRISRLIGTSTLDELEYLPHAFPPFQGAVDHYLKRIIWGGATTEISDVGCVWAHGSRYPKLGMGLHNIARCTGSGANPLVTALKYIEQDANFGLKPVVGWADDSNQGIDKIGTSYQTSTFRSARQQADIPFAITGIRFPLMAAMAANMTITIKFYIDNGSTTKTLTVVNNTNFANSQRRIYLNNLNGINVYNDVYVEFAISGIVLSPVGMPIAIERKALAPTTK